MLELDRTRHALTVPAALLAQQAPPGTDLMEFTLRIRAEQTFSVICTVLGQQPGRRNSGLNVDSYLGMDVEVFCESCSVWLPAKVDGFDLPGCKVTTSYKVTARQCIAGGVAGLRKKDVAIKDGSRLRLPPAPLITKTTWVVKAGWMLRESKPHWLRTFVTLYSDGHIELRSDADIAQCESCSPGIPGRITARTPKTARTDHPEALRLDFICSVTGKKSWKHIMEPEPEKFQMDLRSDWWSAITRVQDFPVVPACEACCDCLVSPALLPEEPRLYEFVQDVQAVVQRVEQLLCDGDSRQIKKLSDAWKTKRAASPVWNYIIQCLAVWIDHQLQVHMVEQPIDLFEDVDSSCPYQIMQRSLSAVIDKATGLKALVVCGTTLALVSAVFGTQDLAKRQVFLQPRKINDHNNWERMSHFEAVVYITPSDHNLQCLMDELKEPNFKSYHVVLASHRDMRGLQWYDEVVHSLALADRFGLVRCVEVSLTGFVPAGSCSFTFEGTGAPAGADIELQTTPLSQLQERARGAGVDEEELTRALDDENSSSVNSTIVELIEEKQQVQKLLGALLSFGRPVVRYSVGSGEGSAVHKLATAIAASTTEGTPGERWDKLAENALGPNERTVVLVLDRAEDLITPLLAPLTYQTVIHEVLGIKGNAVTFTPHDSDQSCTHSLQLDVDEFWAKHSHSFLPDVDEALQELKEKCIMLGRTADDDDDLQLQKEVQLDENFGALLRLPRATKPAAKFILAAQEEDDEWRSWKDAIATTPFAPIMPCMEHAQPDAETDTDMLARATRATQVIEFLRLKVILAKHLEIRSAINHMDSSLFELAKFQRTLVEHNGKNIKEDMEMLRKTLDTIREQKIHDDLATAEGLKKKLTSSAGDHVVKVDDDDGSQLTRCESIAQAVVELERTESDVPPDAILEWMWGDVGMSMTRILERMNPARWSGGDMAAILDDLRKRMDECQPRKVDIRVKGRATIYSFESEGEAADWIERHLGSEPEPEPEPEVIDSGAVWRLQRRRALLLFAFLYQDELWEWTAGSRSSAVEPSDLAAFERPTNHGQEFLSDGICLSDAVDGDAERKLIREFVWKARKHGARSLREEMRQGMKDGERHNAAVRKAAAAACGEEEAAGFEVGPGAARPVLPRLARTLQQLMDGSLSAELYPSCGATGPSEVPPRPRQVVVFVAGGVTHEEVRAVHEFNQQHWATTRVTLGGEYAVGAAQFVGALTGQQ